MERLVLVHGSVVGAAATWGAQQSLGERFELVLVERPGFPPGPLVERVDFEADAELVAGLVRDGDHLVGHSYGGVVALLAAAQRTETLRSLTVIEPPATRVARGDPAVDAFAAGADELWATGPRDDPEAFLRLFLRAVGSSYDPPSPLPPDVEQGARALVNERLPSEAEIPLATLRAAPFPKLVVSGGHSALFDGVCDVLEAQLPAQRVVLAGAGHSIPTLGAPVNDVLSKFWTATAG